MDAPVRKVFLRYILAFTGGIAEVTFAGYPESKLHPTEMQGGCVRAFEVGARHSGLFAAIRGQQTMQVQEQIGGEAVSGCCPAPDSLFERCGWFYALCREHLFYDHSEEIARALFQSSSPETGTHLLELGCGPGFYACRFAENYPEMRTTGIDLSRSLLARARTRATQLRLKNCSFHLADVHALPATVGRVDAIVVSRLFLVVPNRNDVMREIFRVLRPGGKCFVAEPVSSARTQFPLSAMWLLAKLTSFTKVPYVEPHRVTTMGQEEFQSLVKSQPWGSVHLERNGRYQTAVCTKSETEEQQPMTLTEMPQQMESCIA